MHEGGHTISLYVVLHITAFSDHCLVVGKLTIPYSILEITVKPEAVVIFRTDKQKDKLKVNDTRDTRESHFSHFHSLTKI